MKTAAIETPNIKGQSVSSSLVLPISDSTVYVLLIRSLDLISPPIAQRMLLAERGSFEEESGSLTTNFVPFSLSICTRISSFVKLLKKFELVCQTC